MIESAIVPSMNEMLKRHYHWLAPIALFAALTPFISEWDLAIERYFYNGHHFSTDPFINFIFNYGVIPGQIGGLVSAGLLLLSYVSSKWRHWRAPALVLVLTMAVGAGFLTHTVFKDHWGRPRPKQVDEFGGQQPFRPYYKPNFFHQPEPSKSFPCGHCTMGFFFFAVALVGKRIKSRRMLYIGIGIAVILGALLGLARMAHGGHFLSDVLFSALLMWLTTLCADWLVFSESRDQP